MYRCPSLQFLEEGSSYLFQGVVGPEMTCGNIPQLCYLSSHYCITSIYLHVLFLIKIVTLDLRLTIKSTPILFFTSITYAKVIF